MTVGIIVAIEKMNRIGKAFEEKREEGKMAEGSKERSVRKGRLSWVKGESSYRGIKQRKSGRCWTTCTVCTGALAVGDKKETKWRQWQLSHFVRQRGEKYLDTPRMTVAATMGSRTWTAVASEAI